MNTTTKISMMVATAALGGLIAGSTSRAATTAPVSSPSQVTAKKMVSTQAGTMAARTMDDTAKHDCKGKNDCKGQGGCKTGDAGCKGKNSCKGKGGCKSS
jgi:hypothetical protein